MPTLLDGAMGTELARRGFGLRAPLWGAGALRDAPDLVQTIHRDYAEAGATALTTNTFGLDADHASLADVGVRLACAAAPHARCVGALGPADPRAPVDAQRAHYAALGRALADAGADVLFAETHTTLAGARTAVDTLRPLGRPVWVALACSPNGTTLGGDVLDARGLDADVVFVGCSEASSLRPALAALSIGAAALGLRPSRARTSPKGFDPNGTSEAALVEAIEDACAAYDVAFVGGCCGTTPSFIAALAARETP
ncbi:MAG: homocysteine S-methyltransferase family protein [Myxococcota bacterium]